MTGHPMAGWGMVAPEGCATESTLTTWIKEGLAFASSLPSRRNKKTSRDAGHRAGRGAKQIVPVFRGHLARSSSFPPYFHGTLVLIW